MAQTVGFIGEEASVSALADDDANAIHGGLSLLLIAGGAYGAKKIMDDRKK